MVATGFHHDARDIDITETTIGLRAQFHGVAMTRYHTVADTDILAETWRGRFQGDAVIVAIGQDTLDNDLMTAIDIQCIVVVVVAIEHLDVLYPHTVASQIMLHPTTRVLEGDILDCDILALDKTNQVWTGKALIVPRQFFEGAASPVDGTKAINHNIFHLIGIDQLDGGCLRAQRYIVGPHWLVVLQVCAAKEGSSLFKVEVYV